MCTLIIHRDKHQIVFTSNRDDNPIRDSLELQEIDNENSKIYYPKDKLKNGTWFAFDILGNVAILLNGGLEKHQKCSHHTVSRGILPIEILESNSSVESFFSSKDLYHFEPFTMIIYLQNELWKVVWSGNSTTITTLPNQQKDFIFSSVTLYDEAHRNKRAFEYEKFNQNVSENKANGIFDFLTKPTEDLENGFFIKRSHIETLSTSQLVLTDSEIDFKIKSHIKSEIKTITLNKKPTYVK